MLFRSAEIGATNVIVVQVDTLRADRMTVYGSERDTMPETGGENWLVVNTAYSASSWTLPSTVSLFTALSPHRHGVMRVNPDGSMPTLTSTDTTAGVFHDAGYDTFAVTGNQALKLVDGAFFGFDEVDLEYASGSSPDLKWEVSNIAAWLDQRDSDAPFFVHLQPMDVHGPYSPDDEHLGTFTDPDALPFDLDATEAEQLEQFQAAWDAADEAERTVLLEQLHAIYDEDILSMDSALAGLLGMLSERGHALDTLVVVTADHGETLAEELTTDKVFFGHGGKVREELVRVPLMFYHPSFPPDDRVDCVAENVDTMQTVLQAVGLEPLSGVDGQPLQDGCRDFARTSVYDEEPEDLTLGEVGVTDGVSSLRWDCGLHVASRYDLTTDPTAVSPVDAADFPDDARLTKEMEAHVADIQAAVGVDCSVE